jgi:hypothetical protein
MVALDAHAYAVCRRDSIAVEGRVPVTDPRNPGHPCRRGDAFA